MAGQDRIAVDEVFDNVGIFVSNVYSRVQNIRYFFINKLQLLTQGYTDYDWFEYNQSFFERNAKLLHDLRVKGNGYGYVHPEDYEAFGITEEDDGLAKWNKMLAHIEACFRLANYETLENKYASKVDLGSVVDGSDHAKRNYNSMVWCQFCQEEDRLDSIANAARGEGMKYLSKYIGALWD